MYGIVNGTCNHILTTMTREGRGFDDVLAEAQRLGLAEANPATDIDGIDSAHKLALLTALAFGVRPRFADIPTEGIRHVDAIDIAFARELGYTIKLLAIAKDGERAIEARVHPTMIPERASARRRGRQLQRDLRARRGARPHDVLRAGRRRVARRRRRWSPT